MNRFRSWALALAALLALAISASADVKSKQIVKSVGGSTGDSSIVAADTSAAERVPSTVTEFYVVAWSDSQSIYATLVTPDGGEHWIEVDRDTVAAGGMEATAALSKYHANMSVKVILDKIPATGAGKSSAILQFVE